MRAPAYSGKRRQDIKNTKDRQRNWSRFVANKHAQGLRGCVGKALQDPCAFNFQTGNMAAGGDDTLDNPHAAFSMINNNKNSSLLLDRVRYTPAPGFFQARIYSQ